LYIDTIRSIKKIEKLHRKGKTIIESYTEKVYNEGK